MSDYFARIAQALACDAPTQKCALVKALHQDVLQDRTVPDGDARTDERWIIVRNMNNSTVLYV